MPSLFDPLLVGDLALPNRIIMAPLTRSRASSGRVPNALMAEYYAQRASAGLILSEATAVTPRGRITPYCLGLWDDTTAAAMSDTLGRARHMAPKMPVCIQLAHAGRKASSEVPWRGDLLTPAERFVNGTIAVPTTPGFGIALNEELVRRYVM